MPRTYEDTLDWIHRAPRFSPNLTMERFVRLLDKLGRPQRCPRYIHIAGTNGKGSVTAMIASMLHAAGLKTGMYTSPSLEDFRERIAVDGAVIGKDDLCDLATGLESVVEDLAASGSERPIEFELITAIAFMYFRQTKCDFVSLEVGLGGQYDATNVIVPEVSVITTIGLDHTEILGDTLTKIAGEKAGIIKPGVPVVTGVREREALNVISARAEQASARLYAAGQDFAWEEVSSGLDGQVITVSGPGFEYRDLFVPLLGRHQQTNAAVALTAMHIAKARGALDFNEQAIRKGMSSVRWPGRLEVMHRDPLVILDGAHNPEGAAVLSDTIRGIERARLICVMGVLGDKLYPSMVGSIAPECDMLIATTPAGPRALKAEAVAEEASKYTRVETEPDPVRAVDRALSMAGRRDAVLCCGSLYLVGPVRTYLREKCGLGDNAPQHG